MYVPDLLLVAAILLPGHPYIESTTVLSDTLGAYVVAAVVSQHNCVI